MLVDNRAAPILTITLAATAMSMAPVAQADSSSRDGQSSSRQVVGTGVLGDIDTFQPAHPGKWHFQGSLGVATSDYSRGSYDNEDDSLDQVAFGIGLSSTVELVDDTSGLLQGLYLTLGTSNGIASNDNRLVLRDDGRWYESNWYLGLAARLGKNWLGAITHSGFSSPITDFDFSHETTLAAQYIGRAPIGKLNPQLKLTKPVGEQDDGWIVAANIAPETKLETGERYPVTLKFPVEIGVGFDDYHGKDSGTAGYLDVGIAASIPLRRIPERYGRWKFTGQLGVLARSEDVRQADPPVSRDTLIPSASLSLSMVY